VIVVVVIVEVVVVDPVFSIKLLTKKEKSLIWKAIEHFQIMWKPLTEVKEKNCLIYYKGKYSRFIIKSVTEIYSGYEIKVKIINYKKNI
jgi:hypothetical protein